MGVEQVHLLNDELLINMIKDVGEEAEYVTVEGDPRCTLIFAGIDPQIKQKITIGQVNHYTIEEGGMLIPGIPGAQLFMQSQKSDPKDVLELNFPSTYLFSYKWPLKELQDVPCLNMNAWGSGSKVVKDHTVKDFHKLWRLDSVDDIPWLKPMIFAITLKDAIGRGAEHGIGGLAQIVSVDINRGITFQGYSKNKSKDEIEFEMRYENGHWIQKNKDGKIVKTLPSFTDTPDFTPEEIVDWMDQF